jgi:hypothetical protein
MTSKSYTTVYNQAEVLLDRFRNEVSPFTAKNLISINSMVDIFTLLSHDIHLIHTKEMINFCHILLNKRELVEIFNKNDDIEKILIELDDKLFIPTRKFIISSMIEEKLVCKLPVIPEYGFEINNIIEYIRNKNKYQIVNYKVKDMTYHNVFFPLSPIVMLYIGCIEINIALKEIDEGKTSISNLQIGIDLVRKVKSKQRCYASICDQIIVQSLRKGLVIDKLNFDYYDEYIKLIERYISLMKVFSQSQMEYDNPLYEKYFVSIPETNNIIEEFKEQININHNRIESQDEFELPLVFDICVDPNQHMDDYISMENIKYQITIMMREMEKEYDYIPVLGKHYISGMNQFKDFILSQ